MIGGPDTSGPVALIIAYRGFYDVPRYFVVLHEGALLLFANDFDDEADDYGADYTVFVLDGQADLSGSWDRLPSVAVKKLGRVPVAEVRFDPSRRHSVEVSSFDRIVSEPGQS
jgi:hypothetical protein